MKKQLSTLCASILLTTNASAISINPGDNAILALQNSFSGTYLIDTGVSADTLASGAGLSFDISAASAFMGGVIDNFALFGLTSSSSAPGFNYAEFLYVHPGAGILYAGSDPSTPGTHLELTNSKFLIMNQLSNVSFGPDPLVTNVDFVLSVLVGLTPIISSAPPLPFPLSSNMGLHHIFANPDTNSNSTLQLSRYSSDDALAFCLSGSELDNYDSLETCLEFGNGLFPLISLENNVFTLRSGTNISAVPIPSAAWLFISAAGLLFSRQRKPIA